MESAIKTRRSRRNILEIHDLLKEFKTGGSSALDFCKKHDISKATFYKWQSRYQQLAQSKRKRTGFARVDITPSSPAQNILFAEVKGIKIYQVVSATFLKELLG